MRFLHPYFLYALVTLPLLWAVLIYWDRRVRRALRSFGAETLLEQGRLAPHRWTERLRRAAAVLALGLILLALARPQWGERFEEIRRKGLDIALVLDVSSSMDATDIKPSRLEAAKGEITAFLDQTEGDRVALACFAGEPALICPLTLDFSALRIFLDAVDTSTISRPGTAIGSAIDLALTAFDPAERRYKVLVLLTDGEDHQGQTDEAVKRAQEQGVIVFAIGIGTADGELIAVKDSNGQFVEWKKDLAGRVVKSRLDSETLRGIATATGGRFFAITSGGGELKRIAEEIAEMDKKELHAKVQTVYEERFQWFLLPGIALLLAGAALPARPRAAAERRTVLGSLAAMWILAVALALLAPPPRDAAADSAYSSNEAGNRLYAEGKFDDAFKKYAEAQAARPDLVELKYNEAAALYKQGKTEEATRLFREALSLQESLQKSSAAYGLGNSYYKAGDLDQAVAAYEQALRFNPSDHQAKVNLEMALKRKNDKQQQQKNQPPPQDRNTDEQKKGESPQPPPPDVEQQQMNAVLDYLREKEKADMKKQPPKKRAEPPNGKDW